MSAFIEDQEQAKGLREGFTTGTAATAAAMAAAELLLGGAKLTTVNTPLPPFGDDNVWTVAVEKSALLTNDSARASVIKDGGDDPDATHGARLVAELRLLPEQPGTIVLQGGVGVGRVTLPGLPVPVGEWAINPVPRQQITHSLRAVARQHAYTGGLSVTLSVPDGEERARHTFNPRLGIVGGISILGTQGIVRPYSHDAWRATIRQGLDVAVATGCKTLCLSTGRRSEKLLLALYPMVTEQCAVQVADFAEFSLREAGKLPIPCLAWGCFFGKLVKLAQGHSYTHARHSELDFGLLSRWSAEAGLPMDFHHCVTANHALDLLLERGLDTARPVLEAITLRAQSVAADFASRPVQQMRVHFFHLNGQELVRV